MNTDFHGFLSVFIRVYLCPISKGDLDETITQRAAR